MTALSDTSVPWYRTLDKRHWKALLATNLGWMFDGYETFALILTLGVALRAVLDRRNTRKSPPTPEPFSPSRCSAGASAGCSAACSPITSAASAR